VVLSFLHVLSLFAAAGFALWIYFRREPRVAGVRWLAAARALTLIVVALLLWNPLLPADDLPGGRPRIVLIDQSLSMAAREDDGSAWTRAAARAGALSAGGARILPFGGERGLPPGLPVAPEGRESRLLSAVERAVELGARSITVVSDLRIPDAAAVAAGARGLGLDLQVEGVGGVVAHAGIASFDLPPSVAGTDSLPARVTFFGESVGGGEAPPRTLLLEIREEERLVWSGERPLPPPGREGALEVTLPPPSEAGTRIYSARVVGTPEAFPDDDVRLRAVQVDRDPGGLVLVSLRPDFEPRFLFPLLRDVTGLSARGYLAAGEGRYLEVNPEPDADPVVDEATVRRLAEGAEVVVLHGVDRGAPMWVREVAGSARILLLLPRDPEGAALGGVTTGPVQAGEWLVPPQLAPSALAGELAGVRLGGLTPLEGVLPIGIGVSGEVPLRAQLQGRGTGEPMLLLRTEGERRIAVALASGFWRWGFRDGDPREFYRRLWAGVGGWLLAGDPLLESTGGVRLVTPVLPRGEDAVWLVPGRAEEAVRLRLTPLGVQEGSMIDPAAPLAGAVDTLLTVSGTGRVRWAGLAPGAYGWEVLENGPEGESLLGEGRLHMERWVPEMMLPPADLAGMLARGAGDGEMAGPERIEGAGRPLRTHPLPFLLLLALLCAEWIVRRRRGLR
jgi:hypothetical protein